MSQYQEHSMAALKSGSYISSNVRKEGREEDTPGWHTLWDMATGVTFTFHLGWTPLQQLSVPVKGCQEVSAGISLHVNTSIEPFRGVGGAGGRGTQAEAWKPELLHPHLDQLLQSPSCSG